jgi:RNA polymerase sigma-70 factor (ECF subfamily)
VIPRYGYSACRGSVGIPTAQPPGGYLSSSNAAGLSVFPWRWAKPITAETVANVATDYMTRDDEYLLLCIKSGDREALGVLFDRYAKLVLSVGQRIIRDTAEAEDLVHDVFLFLLDKCDLFDPTKGSARAWLAKVTYHRALDRRRYLARRCFYDCRDASNSAIDRERSNASESPELWYWHSYLRRAFDDLSEEQRTTLKLHFFEGFTINEISERMGTPPGNVRHYYYRGLERLRNLMTRGELQRQKQ